MRQRAGLAEARDAAIDQPRLLLGELLVAEPEFFHDARAVVLHEDLTLGDQRLRDANAVRVTQIQADAALVPVQAQVRAALERPHLVADRAQPVAFGGLDLDDLGTEFGKQHRAVRPGDALAEVDEAHPLKGQSCCHDA